MTLRPVGVGIVAVRTDRQTWRSLYSLYSVLRAFLKIYKLALSLKKQYKV